MTNETVTKSARFYCVSLSPDICKTPVGSSTPPIPYSITGEFVDTQNASPNVKSHSEPVILHQRSIIPTVKGDAAGKAGGVKSGTVGKQVDTKVASSIHRANGAYLVQMGREVWMNSRNTVGKIYERGGEAAKPVLKELKAAIREAAQDYKDHGSRKMHGAAEDLVDVGGNVLTGSAVLGVAGVGVAATGVGAPAAAAMEAGAAAGAVAGTATVATGTAMNASATVLDQAADYILTGKTPDLLNTASDIVTNAAGTVLQTAVFSKVPGGKILSKFLGKKAAPTIDKVKEKLVGKKPDKPPPKLDKPPPKNGGDDGKSRGRKEPKSEPPSDCCPKDSGPAKKPVKGRKPVHFGTGQEILYQTDFALERSIPIAWTRCYRSGAECEDWGLLGARWSTPYTTSLSLCDAGIVYHDDSGRALRLPGLEPGQQHDSRKEGFTLTRDNADSFSLLWRDGSVDRFARAEGGWLPHGYDGVNAMLVPSAPVATQRFALVRSEGRDGRGISIDRLIDAKPGDVLLRLRSDDGGVLEAMRGEAGKAIHIGSIDEILPDGGRLCHVRYEYAAETNETQPPFPPRHNLVSQSNALGDTRRYSYRHHLLTSCGSYTGFTYELEWISLDALRARWSGSPLSEQELPQHHPVTLANSYQARAIATRACDGSEHTRIDYVDNDTSRVTENGGVLEYTFDANWLATEVRRVLDGKAASLGRREWDRDGMLLADIDANGAAMRYAYDAAGNLTRSTDAKGHSNSIDYDSQNQPVAFTDPLGNTTRRDYDAAGRPVSITDALGHVTRYRYDPHGQLVELVDARGGSKHFQYNRHGWLTSYTDCSGHTSEFAYDALGRLEAARDALGHATRYEYDALGRLIRLTAPDQTREQYAYDGDGNLVLHVDAAGQQTRFRYNGQGLPVERTDAIGQTLQYRYDATLQLTELINAKGESYRLAYHAEGWLSSETGFDGKRTHYSYDPAGNLTATECGSQRTQLLRDALGLLQVKTTADGAVRYAYDALGRLTAVSAPQAEQRFFHDALGQLIEERSACFLQTLPEAARLPNTPRAPDASFVMTHSYDELGNRIQTVLPNGRRVDTLRYGSGHWHGVLWHGKTVVDVERDKLHREKQRQLGTSGLLATRQYDPQSRLTRLTLTRGADAPSPLRERRFDYDAQGNLRTISQTGTTATGPLGNLRYAYDPVGQLLSAVQPGLAEHFAFDPAGNLVVTAPASGNVLKRYGNTEYDYDEQGNATAKRFHPPGRESSWSDLELEYDTENRLSHATRTERQSRHSARYFYDAFSRRIAKRVEEARWSKQQDITKDQPTRKSATTTFFVWDGDTLAQELGRDETVTYLYEPDSFVPLARIGSPACRQTSAVHLPRVAQWDLPASRHDTELQAAITQEQADTEAQHVSAWQRTQALADGAAAHDRITHYHCDHLGTPRELTDAQGNLVWSGGYKAWGRLLHVEGEIEQPLRFQGQYEDQETGLFYNRYRYYEPETSRYLSQDPVGLSGGVNLYTYAPNPTMWIDPLGLQKKCNTCCIGGRFSSADGAARAALTRYNPKSIRDNLEYGGLIYKGKNGKYDFTKATRGDLDGVDPWSGKKISKNCEETGYWHTHGNYSKRDGTPTTKENDYFNSNDFSPADKNAAKLSGQGKTEYRGYVGTPSGVFKGYNSKSGITYTL
ncbi:RHS repeat-associated core domain-containing protein [Janthinobacterium lividum]|uniref:RHS repeat-associated core domain-containing protein n=1 Tax=Janthinobacterium lividum TaxID=29581 RepID=A0ABU0XWL2_9BURK|nr:RHS repeat-associated core domain-containing protein [Janthinobacterium lividum]MDQ4627952.1 RHS repeat-associated core domain-containing protein [Janthinobacterium lividum]MDQ4676770.1 RHS repeat-associated core domain-containing protein [Janthinobacterium lividum]MDQ4686758.1 RHS repeat-associated core domain-containing protein [Janthinobacterium lividum]